MVIMEGGQDDTDLDKALNYYNGLPQFTYQHFLMITGATGGNVSQEFANYNVCWRFPQRQIGFLSDSGVVLYLAAGKHEIHAAAGFKCGIIPLGEPCASITTRGLRWNLGAFFRPPFGNISEPLFVFLWFIVSWTFRSIQFRSRTNESSS